MALFYYKEKKNKGIRAAAYLRLSIEDGDKAESNSIGNQRELIQNFVAERPELHLVGEYADDGYTGTNFERPGFTQMMEDIQSDKINCIMRNTQPERSLWITIRTKNKNMIGRLRRCRIKLNNPRRKKLPRALFQERYAQRQNRQKISCTARDLRQVWYRPSSKMFMCMRVGESLYSSNMSRVYRMP